MSVGNSVEFEFSPNGKATKKYGPTTYRFNAALTLGVIVPRRGWTVVKKAKNYVYLIPPSKRTAPPIRISIAVLDLEIARSHAEAMREANRGWGQLGEWPAWYHHERDTDMRGIRHD